MNQRYVPPLYRLRLIRWPLIQALWAKAQRGARSPELWRAHRRIIAGTMRMK
ncbi:MAG: hypothetical protein AAGA23_09285 [Pseudomonadota bacterium]